MGSILKQGKYHQISRFKFILTRRYRTFSQVYHIEFGREYLRWEFTPFRVDAHYSIQIRRLVPTAIFVKSFQDYMKL